MDIIVKDHSPENLANTFDAEFLYDHPLFSLIAKRTEIKWLVIIPKQEIQGSENLEYIGKLYSEIQQLADFVQQQGIGGHYNLAKIGNKHPNYHIHLVFRDEKDEAWPDAIWCREPLTPCSTTANDLKSALAPYFNS